MFIFLEGLPRSGKSYSACVDHVIAALLAGRHVWAYIEGLDHEKFAEVTGLDIDTVRELLHQVSESEVLNIAEICGNDSLVVLDEMQDFWPVGRSKLSESVTKFVTQHGHRGIDIVGMGQDLRDVHALWKRRVHRKFVYLQQTGIGRPDRYKWEAFEARAGKFEKISSGTKKYDPQYFGLYASHSEGTENKDTLLDDRTNILKTGAIRVGLPAAAVVGMLAIAYLVSFLTGGASPVSPGALEAAEAAESVPVQRLPPPPPAASRYALESAPAVAEAEPSVPDPLAEDPLWQQARVAGRYVRLVAWIEYPGRRAALVEVVDAGMRRQYAEWSERSSRRGWVIERAGEGVYLTHGDVELYAGPVRIDSPYRVATNVAVQADLGGSP